MRKYENPQPGGVKRRISPEKSKLSPSAIRLAKKLKQSRLSEEELLNTLTQQIEKLTVRPTKKYRARETVKQTRQQMLAEERKRASEERKELETVKQKMQELLAEERKAKEQEEKRRASEERKAKEQAEKRMSEERKAKEQAEKRMSEERKAKEQEEKRRASEERKAKEQAEKRKSEERRAKEQAEKRMSEERKAKEQEEKRRASEERKATEQEEKRRASEERKAKEQAEKRRASEERKAKEQAEKRRASEERKAKEIETAARNMQQMLAEERRAKAEQKRKSEERRAKEIETAARNMQQMLAEERKKAPAQPQVPAAPVPQDCPCYYKDVDTAKTNLEKFYKDLNCSENDRDKVKEKYKKDSRSCHPDKCGRQPTDQIFRQIQEFYNGYKSKCDTQPPVPPSSIPTAFRRRSTAPTSSNLEALFRQSMREKIPISSSNFIKILGNKQYINQVYQKDPKNVIPFKIEVSSKDTYIFVDNGFVNAGTFGILYKAIRQRDNKLVGIKLIKRSNDFAQKDIDTELQAFSQTKICGDLTTCYIDHYVVDNHTRIVMNYVNGPPLDEYMAKIPLKTNPRNPNIIGRQDRHDFAKDLINAFDMLHSIQKITQQDEKDSGNILWDNITKRPVLIDFGQFCSKNTHCTSSGWFGRTRIETCQKPCGFLGTEYTSPPEFKPFMDIYYKKELGLSLTQKEQNYLYNTFPYIEGPVSFDDTRAHDIWSIGVILLRWYASDTSELVVNPPAYYKWTPKKLADKINTAPGEVRDILKLLLEQDKLKRVQNWVLVKDRVNNLLGVKFDNPEYERLIETSFPAFDANVENAKNLSKQFAGFKFYKGPMAFSISIDEIKQLCHDFNIDINLSINQVLTELKRSRLLLDSS